MQETRVRFRGREASLEKEMATHYSVLAWRIPWTGETARLQSTGSQKSDTTEQLSPCTPWTRRENKTAESNSQRTEVLHISDTEYKTGMSSV